jgi:hypothetical protein
MVLPHYKPLLLKKFNLSRLASDLNPFPDHIKIVLQILTIFFNKLVLN